MASNQQDSLIAAARAHVAAVCPGESLRRVIVLTSEGTRLSIELVALGNPASRPPAVPPCRGLSPLEGTILEALAGAAGTWRTAQQLAEVTGQSKSSYFMAVLANLAEAGVIESSTKSGYRQINNSVEQCGN